jgi:molybdopterin molybdotransferase
MITFNEALQIICNNAKPLDTETIPLGGCLNRVLAEDIFSDIDLPPFHKSAMDGFACKRADLPGPLKVVDEIPAGKHSEIILHNGECARIMTGAPIPEGADTVFMIEYHEMNADGMVSFKGHATASNICLKGEDVKIGDLILEKGKLLKSHEIAILAGAGKEGVKVFKQPAVAVLSTGAELVEPGKFPVNGQIRNSNGPQMMAQLAEMGIRASYEGIVTDDKINLRHSIEKALEKCDVLFISGGVSVGDYDFVPRIVEVLGFDILITTISTKPGKHTLFAVKDGKYVLGFPGNPVSSYVQLELIGKTLLYQLMGHEWKPRRYRVTIARDYNRKNADRLEFIPVDITDEGQAALVSYNGSAHIGALAGAHALMEIPAGTQSFKQGDIVYVRPL